MANIEDVFFKGVKVNEDVIKLNNVETVEILTKTIIGINLHRCRDTGKTKGYNKILNVAITRLKCCFPFIAEGNAELINSIS